LSKYGWITAEKWKAEKAEGNRKLLGSFNWHESRKSEFFNSGLPGVYFNLPFNEQYEKYTTLSVDIKKRSTEKCSRLKNRHSEREGGIDNST